MSDLDELKKIAIHAKYLFTHACSHASEQDPVQRMIALHDMHNAVEWLLGGLWTYHGITEQKPFHFMKLFDKLEGKQRLILKNEIRVVNEARNHAQHHAAAPSADALARYIGYCEAFFRQTLRDVLSRPMVKSPKGPR